MAKWGEGDPRWIVEERPDATNVNNWHWTEKNACAWSQDKIKELFNDLEIGENDLCCKVTEIETCEGEAVVNNRKGKLIFFYEWNIVLKWVSVKSNEIEGKITIPNLSEENDISEVDVEFSKGMILPKKDNSNKNVVNSKTTINVKAQMNTTVVSSKNKSANYQIDTIIIKQQQKFQCRAVEFFNMFTTIEMVQAFTKGPVRLEPKKGGKFELFGGNIHGEFVELSPEKIVQKWRSKQWDEGHFSEVILDIREKSDHTEVNLTQTGVPKTEEESTKENWDRYYWDAIKRTFGFGYFM
ncbi:hypothetical protein PV326_008060 [Microctonus aethiopoides]|nr:hypothetical protein PV326_008060 [Microctonus aethiopoides]